MDFVNEPAATNGSAFVSLAEAAAILGIHRQTAYKLRSAGNFPVPVRVIGNRYKVSKAALDAYLRQAQAG